MPGGGGRADAVGGRRLRRGRVDPPGAVVAGRVELDGREGGPGGHRAFSVQHGGHKAVGRPRSVTSEFALEIEHWLGLGCDVGIFFAGHPRAACRLTFFFTSSPRFRLLAPGRCVQREWHVSSHSTLRAADGEVEGCIAPGEGDVACALRAFTDDDEPKGFVPAADYDFLAAGEIQGSISPADQDDVAVAPASLGSASGYTRNKIESDVTPASRGDIGAALYALDITSRDMQGDVPSAYHDKVGVSFHTLSSSDGHVQGDVPSAKPGDIALALHTDRCAVLPYNLAATSEQRLAVAFGARIHVDQAIDSSIVASGGPFTIQRQPPRCSWAALQPHQ
mmetsp:Transcript_51577/g.167479  ORF Transcript_51577/g.167479 Transcript_51577/m.167479 type:complete len:336 (+) Transcript_51577:416-1423(+)